MKSDVLNNLVATNMMLSTLLQDLRDLKYKKDYALKKFMETVDGPDWRKSKFFFSIDLCRTNIWKIENTIQRITAFQKCICNTGAFVNKVGNLFAKSDIIDLSQQMNLKILKSPEDMSPNIDQNNFSSVKQRSAKWFQERAKMKVKGSTIYKALGCDGLKRQKEQFESVICSLSLPLVVYFWPQWSHSNCIRFMTDLKFKNYILFP